MIYLMAALIVLLDQITKYAAVKYLKGRMPYVIIENFFQFQYVENFGAAFGILQNRKIFFIVITSLVIISIVLFVIKNSHNLSLLMKIALFMLLGGAIGNLIDRVRLGYVIDFISFKFGKVYNFPVFNIADVFIVVGTFLIMLLVIFNKYEI